ncbi:hypothetical protein [Methylobacterium sp. JK268]
MSILKPTKRAPRNRGALRVLSEAETRLVTGGAPSTGIDVVPVTHTGLPNTA